MNKPSNSALGKSGEAAAKLFLEKKGLRVLAENHRTPFGEIDLICLDREELVFVEVKLRTTPAFGDGMESIDARKVRRIMMSALHYLKSKGMEERTFRFDIISIRNGTKTTHIERAFP